MTSRAFVLLFILLPFLSTAQHGNYSQQGGGYMNQNESSILSVFSESGEPFYLILNGIKQNAAPQTKIRVEALPQYITDVQITFPDGSQPLRKKVVISDPLDGRAVNLTLKVSRGERGIARLKFHRMTECDRNYHGPRDEYVMYYGKPQQINTVTETTYTDPVTGQQVTQTTTTTTDNNNYNNTNYNNNYNNNNYNNNNNNGHYNNNHNTPPPPPPPPAPMAMDDRTFGEAKRSIASSSFDDTKLSTAKTILNSNYVTTNQVMELCRMFSFEDNKLAFAEYAYSRTIDKGSYFKVASIFSFDSNKTALNDFINSQR